MTGFGAVAAMAMLLESQDTAMDWKRMRKTRVRKMTKVISQTKTIGCHCRERKAKCMGPSSRWTDREGR
jgi:hypothetical protein